jgi:carboxypeptidase family protein
MRSIHTISFAVLLLAGWMSGGRAYGQGGATGAVSGTVVDTSGGSVAGADVQIIDTRTETLVRKVPTNSDGAFVVTLLPPGIYSVVVNKSGFAQAKADGMEVRVTETTKVTITLKPGSVSEKVEISAQVTTVETTNATTGQSLGTETVRELPLATQNYQQLLTLSAGAQSELNAAAQLGRGSVKLFVNGQREDNNNFLIEGISATDYNVAQATYVPLPNPDVIQEFKVQTSLYDASQGRNGGGNVNAILKSGTKELHGDAYEFFRNDVLNANEFFLNRQGQPRPVVKQNIFGGSLGGPVGTEKGGYFFVNYQGTRQRSGLSPGTFISTNIPYIPAADRASLTTLEADCNVPSIDPVIFKLLNFKSNQFGGNTGGYLFPAPANVPAGAKLCDPTNPVPFVVSRPGKYTDDQFTSNWDREFRGGADKVSARFFFSDSESFLPFGGGDLQESLGSTLASSISSASLNFPFDTPVHARFFNVTETHLFSPTLVNEFRFGFVHINDVLGNIAPVTVSDLGIDRPTNSVTNSIYKFVLASSGFEVGPAPFADQHQTQNNYNLVDTVSWVRKKHVFRFGGEYTRVNLDKLFPQVFNGEIFFTNTPAGSVLPTATTDFQNYLLGAPQFSFGGGGVANHQYRTNNYGFFAQDDWKIRQDLTLNFGVRTEIFGGFYDNLCHIGNLDPALANKGQYPFVYPSCVTKLTTLGLTSNGSRTTYRNNYSTNLGPRIGLAYDLFGHHTTTIRAGFGIYYVREDVGTVDQLSFQAPFLPVAFGGGPPNCLGLFFSQTPPPATGPLSGCPNPNPNGLPQAGTLDPTFVPCLSVFQGFPGNDTTQAANYGPASGAACPGPLLSTSIFGLQVPRHFVVPSTQQWNLTVQHSLGKQWVLEVGYVGTHAVHLRETRDSLQSQRASVADPVKIDSPAFCNPNPCIITTNTFGNAVARSRAQGINGYAGFQLFANDAYSHYHSLQTSLTRRWNAGYFQAAYTFSKSTDATSSGNTAFNTAFNDESTLAASRGLSDFDRPHRFVVSYRYDLPFYRNANGVTGTLLSGWALSGITIFQSGTPFSVTDSGGGTGFLGAGFTPGTLSGSLASGSTLASAATTGDIHKRIDGYLNLNAFATAPQLYPAQCLTNSNFCTTDFGNLGRNGFRGPHQQNWDFSLIKNFKLTERQSLRFTTDFFNIWNHANFGNPTVNDVETIFCSPGVSGCPASGINPNSPFGKITSTVGTPRLIQFSLRYAF